MIGKRTLEIVNMKKVLIWLWQVEELAYSCGQCIGGRVWGTEGCWGRWGRESLRVKAKSTNWPIWGKYNKPFKGCIIRFPEGGVGVYFRIKVPALEMEREKNHPQLLSSKIKLVYLKMPMNLGCHGCWGVKGNGQNMAKWFTCGDLNVATFIYIFYIHTLFLWLQIHCIFFLNC